MKVSILIFLVLLSYGSCQENLIGGVYAGYQGWFGSPQDGTGVGYRHFKMNSKKPFARDNCVIDFWPQTTQYEKKYLAPQFGNNYYTFSAADFSTVRTHFKWMQEYNIDGVFLQRFGSDIGNRNSPTFKASTKVFENVMNSAKQAGKHWALMYDLSGLQPGQIRTIIMQDWKYLNQLYNFRGSSSYIHHKNKPLVVAWGIGFPGRAYTLQECSELIDFFKNGEFGGNSVMIGTPRYWREGGRDAVTGGDLDIFHNILQKADVVSPWTVGRYSTIAGAQNDARVNVKADIAWCNQRSLVLMPVIWPGFSWHNLQASGQNPSNPGPYDQIPRKQGNLYLLQQQGKQVAAAGAKTIYVAMFDEMNEGTAIFKCSQSPPSLGDGLRFVRYAEAPNFYLQLTGQLKDYIK